MMRKTFTPIPLYSLHERHPNTAGLSMRAWPHALGS